MSDNHGKTPAAWTSVTIMLVGFCIAGIAFVVPQHWLFWLGIGVVAIGAVVGKVMSMMGMGRSQYDTALTAADRPLDGTMASDTGHPDGTR